MSDIYSVIQGITFGGMISSIISNADAFTAYMYETMDNRCHFCGYKRNHPIVKHDNFRIECGWR